MNNFLKIQAYLDICKLFLIYFEIREINIKNIENLLKNIIFIKSN